MDVRNLVRVNTYALQKGVTTQTVRNWCKAKKVKYVDIDGVRFIMIK